jgi:predicted O-methyltransferase YrrM
MLDEPSLPRYTQPVRGDTVSTSHIQQLEDYLAASLLSSEGMAQHQAGKVSKHELAPFLSEIAAISASYLSHDVGSTLPSPIKSVRSAEGYALYYSVINAAKVLHLLPNFAFDKDEISVLDLGSGPGTAGLALLTGLNKAIRLTCVEHSPHMRNVAERLLSRYNGAGTLTKLSMLPALPSRPNEPYDLVIAANVVAELDTAEGERMMRSLAEKTAPGGYLVVLEPGQQLHTRRLMHLRNNLLETSNEFVPVFPCLRRDPCPMLAFSDTDWCHGTIEWSQPRLNAHLDDLLSFNKHRIKYSAFIFQRGGVIPSGIRVLTPPEKTRAGIDTLVCGKDTYTVARIRKGARSERNRALEKASVFERLLVSEPIQREIGDEVLITKP